MSDAADRLEEFVTGDGPAVFDVFDPRVIEGIEEAVRELRKREPAELLGAPRLVEHPPPIMVVHPDWTLPRCAACRAYFTALEWEQRHSDEAGEDIHARCCAPCHTWAPAAGTGSES